METNSSRGFTLLELIVVLVIVGLVAGLAVPRLTGSLTTVTLRSAAREAALLLRQSRDTAYFKKQDIKTVFDLDDRSMAVFRYQRPDPDEAGQAGQGPEKIWVRITDYAFPEKISIARCINREDIIENGRFEVLFFPDGNSSGGDIILQDNRKREITITVGLMTGTVRVTGE